MNTKTKKWFANLFKDYHLIFSKIRENKISNKEGISTLYIKYNELVENLVKQNPKNDYFKPILINKLKKSIEDGKPLKIVSFKKNILNEITYFSIVLYELGVETYISLNNKNSVIFNPVDLTEYDLNTIKMKSNNEFLLNNLNDEKNVIINTNHYEKSNNLNEELINNSPNELIKSSKPSEAIHSEENISNNLFVDIVDKEQTKKEETSINNNCEIIDKLNHENVNINVCPEKNEIIDNSLNENKVTIELDNVSLNDNDDSNDNLKPEETNEEIELDNEEFNINDVIDDEIILDEENNNIEDENIDFSENDEEIESNEILDSTQENVDNDDELEELDIDFSIDDIPSVDFENDELDDEENQKEIINEIEYTNISKNDNDFFSEDELTSKLKCEENKNSDFLNEDDAKFDFGGIEIKKIV